MQWVLIIVCLFSLGSIGTCLESGAPLSTCTSLLPSHDGRGPQSQSTLQYSISPASSNYSPNTPIEVKIVKTSTSAPDLQGYVIQARGTSTGTTPHGTFTASQGRVRDCQGGTANSATHSSIYDNQNPTFQWTPPSSDVGEIYFIATVATDFDTFWTNVRSDTITFLDSGNPDPESSTSTNTAQTTTSTVNIFDIVGSSAASIRMSVLLLSVASYLCLISY